MPRFLFYEPPFPGGAIMTMYQRNRIKEEINRQNAAADADADRLLDKLRSSKWTAAILLASAVVLIIILWSLL
jgi:uncharacterized membrane protein